MFTAAAASAMTLLVGSAAHAGPWVKDPGNAYVKAGYVRFSADTFVQPDGTVAEGLSYVGNTSHLYAEVGVAPRLQLVTNVPFVVAQNKDGEVAYINRQGGDMDVGAEVRILGDQVPVSLQALAKIPLYDNADLLQYGLVGANFPAMGDGQVDLTATAAVGTGFSLGSVRGWTAAEAGYRHRTEWWLGDSSQPDRAYVDGVTWHGQLGYSPSIEDRDLGWLSIDASGVHNLSEDEVTKQWVQLSASTGIRVAKGFAAELGASWLPWARASSQGRSISAGVSWSR